MDMQSHQRFAWRSRMLAGSSGVRIVEDPSAETFSMARNGDLTVPSMKEGQPDFEQLMPGATLHEIAHFLWSDYAVLDLCTPIERNYMMAFEDLRIERRAQAEWAGAADELSQMWAALYAKSEISRPSANEEDALYLAGTWALAHCRFEAVGLMVAQDDASLAKQTSELKFGPDITAKVEEVLKLTPQMQSSADALEIARRLITLFVEPESAPNDQRELDNGSADLKPGQQPDQAQAGEGGASGDQGKTDPASSGGQGDDGEEDGGEPLASDAGNGEGEEDADGGDSAGNAAGAGEGDESQDGSGAISIGQTTPSVDIDQFEPLKADGGDLAKTVIAKTANAEPGGGKAGGEHDVHLKVVKSKATARGEMFVESVLSASTALRARAQHLLRTATRERPVPNRRGRITPSRVWRLRFGSMQIFEQESESTTFSTLIHMLNDMSTSMDGGQDQIALGASLAVSLAFQGMRGLETEISKFPAGHNAVAILKTASERAQVAAPRLAATKADGGTPTAEALRALRPHLLKSKADRKILFLNTDGLPKDKQAARAEVLRLEAAGIEVVVIGIIADASVLSPTALRINNVNELPATLFNYLNRSFARHLAEAA